MSIAQETGGPAPKRMVKIAPGTSLNPSLPSKPAESNKCNFPLEVYPLALQELIPAARIANGIPEEYSAAMALFVASSALGKARRARIKKYDGPLMGTFWAAMVGPPNIVKTGTLKFWYKPLVKKDRVGYDEYKKLLGEYDRLASLTKKELAEEGKTFEDLRVPTYCRTTIKDTTWEKLVDSLRDNPRGLTAFRDELAAWLKEMSRYQGPDMENWLSSWSGDDVTKDRVSSGTVRVDEPYLSVVGGIQPGILGTIGAGAKSSNGFIDRMLFVWPDNLKKLPFENITIDLVLVDKWHRAINRIDGLGVIFEDEGIYRFTPEGLEEYVHFFNEDNTPLCNEALENGQSVLAGMYGKQDVYLPRFALVLHVLKWAYSDEKEPAPEISGETVRQAIIITKYFRRQSKKVFRALNIETAYDRLPELRQKIYVALPTRFATGQGVQIAATHNMSERTFKDWLRTGKGLFTKIAHGKYEKACEV